MIGPMTQIVRLGYRAHGNLGAALQTIAVRASMFILSIGTGVVTARSLGASGRGLLGALLTWPQFIAYLMTFGLCASLLLNAKQRPEERGRLFAASLILAGAFGLMAAVVGDIVVPPLVAHYGTAEMNHARLAMLMAPVILVVLVLQTAAEGIGDFTGANLLRGVAALGTFVSVLALALLHELTPLNAAACYLLPQAPIALWLLVRLSAKYHLQFSGFFQAARPLCTFGLRCYPIELVNAANGYLGQVAVVALLPAASVGVFIVSMGISRLLEIFYSAIAAILLPATAARRKTDVVEKTAQAVRLNLLAMLSMALPLIIVMPYVLPAVYGTSFVEAVPVARTLLMEGMLSGSIWVLMQAFIALGRPELATMVHLLVLVVSATLLVTLVPREGALGAAQILLSMSLLKLLLVLLVYRIVLAVSPREFVPRMSDVLHIKTALAR
jgi:O-antigen/teichoic acid export membrane protein